MGENLYVYEDNHVSEAEYMYLNEEPDLEEFNIYDSTVVRVSLNEDRKRRLRNLVGRYIVSTKGISSGKTVFYQDQSISRRGYWTQFITNAQGFNTLLEATTFAKQFKYNNPRIAVVTKEGMYQWIRTGNE